MKQYPSWTDFEIGETLYGVAAPYCGCGVYTLDHKFSWPDMSCVMDYELERWQKHLTEEGYEIPEEYKGKVCRQ